jgi:hypothetical protein
MDRAEVFAALHAPGNPLLLANAGDVGPALAITSAGVACSLDIADGADHGAAPCAAAVARIAAAVDVPVSADMETGYGPAPADVAATVIAIAEAGAVGVNLEDRVDATMFDPAEQALRPTPPRTPSACDVWATPAPTCSWPGIRRCRCPVGSLCWRSTGCAQVDLDRVMATGASDIRVARAHKGLFRVYHDLICRDWFSEPR